MHYELVHFLRVSGLRKLQIFVKFRVCFFPASVSVLLLPSAKHDEICKESKCRQKHGLVLAFVVRGVVQLPLLNWLHGF